MRVSKSVLLALILSLVLTTIAVSAHAEQVVCMNTPPEYSLYYRHTESIWADLSFSGNIANCDGSILPIESLDVSITVSLYKQNGSSWTLLDFWTSSATGGSRASASGTKTVGSGTYKVVTSGNVGGLEYPTTSVTKTKP